jgi:hypothetical protein
MNKNNYKKIIDEKAWCLTHPTGYIGRDHRGHWYKRCRHGHLKNENCEIVIEKGGEKQIRARFSSSKVI